MRDPLLTVALIYRWTALAMSLCWLWQYVPDRQHVGAFMGAALGVFLFAVWKRNREALLGAAVYAQPVFLGGQRAGCPGARAKFEHPF